MTKYMKFSFLILIIFSIFIKTISAQTFIIDKQEVFGTWDTIGSPYIILGEAIIPENKTLKIEPGVEIKFKTGLYREYMINGKINNNFNVGFLRVNGNIKAEGNQENFINFTRNDPYDYWGCIFFSNSSKNNHLKYCKFEYGYFVRFVITDDNATGVVSFNSADGKIENCIFANNGWAAINCKNHSKPKFENCVIYKNEFGIEANTYSTPSFTNCIIWENYQPFFTNLGAKPSISFSLVQGKNLPLEITDKGENIFDKNPMFTNPQEGDFSLLESSPCLFAGTRAKDMGAIKRKRYFY